MDDGSSISSGEISDAVAGVSTDDNITVGSSLSAHSYTDRAGLASQRAAVLHMGSVTLQTSSARRHAASTLAGAATDRTTLPMTSSSSGRDQRPVTSGGAVFIRRSNQAVVTDLKARTLRSGTAVAIDDPARCLATVSTSSSSCSNTAAVKQKKDSETNTDNSTLMLLAQRSRLAAEYSGTTSSAASDVYKRQHNRQTLWGRALWVGRSPTLDHVKLTSQARDPCRCRRMTTTLMTWLSRTTVTVLPVLVSRGTRLMTTKQLQPQ